MPETANPVHWIYQGCTYKYNANPSSQLAEASHPDTASERNIEATPEESC